MGLHKSYKLHTYPQGARKGNLKKSLKWNDWLYWRGSCQPSFFTVMGELIFCYSKTSTKNRVHLLILGAVGYSTTLPLKEFKTREYNGCLCHQRRQNIATTSDQRSGVKSKNWELSALVCFKATFCKHLTGVRNKKAEGLELPTSGTPAVALLRIYYCLALVFIT